MTIARRALPHQEAAESLETDAERHSEAWRAWRQSERWQDWNQAIAPVVAARRQVLEAPGRQAGRSDPLRRDRAAFRRSTRRLHPRRCGWPSRDWATPATGRSSSSSATHDRQRRVAPKPTFEKEPEVEKPAPVDENVEDEAPTSRRRRVHRSGESSQSPCPRPGDKDARPAGFDFTLHMRRLCEDMTDRLPELRHIDLSRVAISFSQARKNTRHGVFASLTPMRFADGRTHTVRRGRKWGVQRLQAASGREMLYILNFCLPRFLDLPFGEKLTTVVHELWHISPAVQRRRPPLRGPVLRPQRLGRPRRAGRAADAEVACAGPAGVAVRFPPLQFPPALTNSTAASTAARSPRRSCFQWTE